MLIPLLTGLVLAQFGGSGALGGPFAGQGSSRPLGGISSAPNNSRGARPYSTNRSGRRSQFGYPFAYSVLVQDYFDAQNDPFFYPPAGSFYMPGYVPPPPPAVPPPTPQQPVIINQYFNAGPQPVAESSPTVAKKPGDPMAPVQNYYLIAYKNHSIYAAMAYWIEGSTLHYVTTENTHNQASLDLVDVEWTKSLNKDRNVSFSLPGQ